jgi:hypothetical protein
MSGETLAPNLDVDHVNRCLTEGRPARWRYGWPESRAGSSAPSWPRCCRRWPTARGAAKRWRCSGRTWRAASVAARGSSRCEPPEGLPPPLTQDKALNLARRPLIECVAARSAPLVHARRGRRLTTPWSRSHAQTAVSVSGADQGRGSRCRCDVSHGSAWELSRRGVHLQGGRRNLGTKGR